MTAARHAAEYVTHACARAYERYGLSLTTRDLAKICRIVQNNEARFDRMNDNRSTQWFLTYSKVPVRVIISPDFHRVVTFIPLTGSKYKPPKQKRRKIYRGGRVVYLASES